MDSQSFIKNRTLRRNIQAYWILIMVVTLLMGYYSFIKFNELLSKSAAINDQSGLVNTLESTLSTEESEYKGLLENKKDLYDKLDAEIANVLPKGENYTNLTRELDAFFLGLSKSNNPIFVANLQYGSARAEESGRFSILPITLTIESSKENFLKFLDYIESSGNLTSKVRLMDVQSIRINFQKEQDNGKTAESVSLNVNLNAYFQTDANGKPVEATQS